MILRGRMKGLKSELNIVAKTLHFSLQKACPYRRFFVPLWLIINTMSNLYEHIQSASNGRRSTHKSMQKVPPRIHPYDGIHSYSLWLLLLVRNRRLCRGVQGWSGGSIWAYIRRVKFLGSPLSRHAQSWYQSSWSQTDRASLQSFPPGKLWDNNGQAHLSRW